MIFQTCPTQVTTTSGLPEMSLFDTLGTLEKQLRIQHECGLMFSQINVSHRTTLFSEEHYKGGTVWLVSLTCVGQMI